MPLGKSAALALLAAIKAAAIAPSTIFFFIMTSVVHVPRRSARSIAQTELQICER
jgi:hypothetical protein